MFILRHIYTVSSGFLYIYYRYYRASDSVLFGCGLDVSICMDVLCYLTPSVDL
jgi:hypothetical protein